MRRLFTLSVIAGVIAAMPVRSRAQEPEWRSFTRFVAKPFTRSTLEAAVRELLVDDRSGPA